MSNYFSPFLEQEQGFRKRIYESLEGGIISQVIDATGAMQQQDDSNFRASLALGSLKVEPEVMPRLYQIFHDTITKLGFDRQVDFYITNSKEVNACTYFGTTPNRPLIININSALIELMTEDELRFVVGHEIGHQINKDGELNKLIRFIFPDVSKSSPILLQLKIRAWSQMCELVADRFGYLATGNRDACISAFFKMHSGLNLKGMNIDINAFVEHNHKLLSHYSEGDFLSLSNSDHPADALRVEAINAYANAASQQDLDAIMDRIIYMICRVTTSEVDYHIPYFLAAAGLIIANADGQVTKEEIESILESISQFSLFPRNILDKVFKEDVQKVFTENLKAILENNPNLQDELFCYIMDQVISDKKLNPDEVNLMIKIGTDVFQFSSEYVMEAFAQRLREVFRPSFSSIC